MLQKKQPLGIRGWEAYGIVLLSVVVAILLFMFLPAKKINVQRTIACVETNSQASVDVIISGTYYRYSWRDDHFVGTITVSGLRECTRDYIFKKDTESFFVDEFGQPIGVIRQQHIFEQISIAENTYNVVSR